MSALYSVDIKIQEITTELQRLGLWKSQVPDWVIIFSENVVKNEDDFEGWIQFILFPNLQQNVNILTKYRQQFLVLQAVKYFGRDLKKGKLLQLLIELDSLL